MNEECKYDCSVGESGDLVSRLRNPSTTTIVPAMAAYPPSDILVEQEAAESAKMRNLPPQQHIGSTRLSLLDVTR